MTLLYPLSPSRSVELDAPATAEEQAAVQELAGSRGKSRGTDSGRPAISAISYIETNVLRVELLDDKPASGELQSSEMLEPWTDAEAEARTVTKIEIGDGVESPLVDYWFSGGSSTSLLIRKLTEVVLPSYR